LRHTAVSTAALGPLTSLPHAATAGDSPGAKRRTKIRIGARISPAWLKSDHDNDLRFLKQIGVDYVDITLDMVKGYAETGCFTKAALQEFLDRLAAVGLRVERANSLGPYYLNAHLGRADGQREIDNLKKIGELLAQAEIPVYGIQACQATQHVKNARAGW